MDADKLQEAIDTQVAEHHEFLDENRTKSSPTGHGWRQRGGHVECDSCELPHSFGLPPNKQLAGIDDKGLPIFRTIQIKA